MPGQHCAGNTQQEEFQATSKVNTPKCELISPLDEDTQARSQAEEL